MLGLLNRYATVFIFSMYFSAFCRWLVVEEREIEIQRLKESRLQRGKKVATLYLLLLVLLTEKGQ